MKEQKILLIFKDGIANFDEVSSLRFGEAKHGFCRVAFKNDKEELRRLYVLGNCKFQGKEKTGDLLVSIRNIASDAVNGEYGNFPLCIGLFGDGNGNVEFHIVNPAKDASNFRLIGTSAIGKRINARSHWRKFFVRLIDSLRNRLKAFGNKLFKFHKFNSVKKDTSDN